MTDFTNNSDDMPKKPGRRNLLRNAAITATSAFLLVSFLTGCHKETQTPGGGVGGSEPDISYVLKVNYKTTKGATAVGYLAPVGTQASTPYYSEFLISNGPSYSTKFQVYAANELGDGWQYLKTDDSLWLSLSYDGYLYRSNQSNRVAWKIVDGKLYNNYSRWKDYPAGSKLYDTDPFIVFGYYAGVNFGDENVLTGCELVSAP